MTEKKYLISVCISAFFTIAGIAGVILTSASNFMVTAVFSAIIGTAAFFAGRRTKYSFRPMYYIGMNIAAVLIIHSMPPVVLNTEKAWQYGFARAYTGMYRNIHEPGWFPEAVSDNDGYFHFDYLPSILQGTGHYSVSVIVSDDTLAEYERCYSEMAVITVDTQLSDSVFIPEEDRKKFINAYSEDHLDIFVDREFWREYSPVRVYVIDGVLNSNHPHSSVVIIDRENRMVQFSQLG